MKISVILSLVLCCLALISSGRAQQSSQEVLTNASVVKLTRAGFSEKTLITIIGARPARFDLSPDAIIELKKRGVSEKVIVMMIARSEGKVVADEGLDDDSFARDTMKQGRESAAEPGDFNIFGSSGGMKGRTRSRSGRGSMEDDMQTLGSASVKIIRPPAEAGGTPQLEKTPALTNQSVVELVEAGFTEGTIIRRIELSPAEFDLTPAKLEDLRRRRVSDRVIAAMSQAMGDDAAASRQTPSSSQPRK